jgi:2-polyprenyl-3-methyl-5-hydroxy-6-metoxy-1,4-benzoquinol methylase
MDDPDLDRARHVEALTALERINRVSLAATRVWREVRRIHATTGRTVRVLDVACGGGDMLFAVARKARRDHVPVAAHGWDISPLAIEEVQRRSTRQLQSRSSEEVPPPSSAIAETRSVQAFEMDALTHDLPRGYDLITSSLFLHHLDRDEAVSLLHRMAASAGRTVLVQDLRRTRLGYALAWVGLHALTRSDVARTDGLLSVRGAFTIDEAESICRAADLGGATVSRVWPQRFVIRWTRA